MARFHQPKSGACAVERGCATLRYRSRLHHAGLGRAHRGKRVLILMAELDVRVLDDDGTMLRHLKPDPSVGYQRQDRNIP